MFFSTPSWDVAIFTWVNTDWRCAFWDLLMPLISAPVFWWMAGLMISVFLVFGGWNKERILSALLCLGLVLGACDLAAGLIKDSVRRVRPYHGLGGAWYVDGAEWKRLPLEYRSFRTGGSSYPSGHSTNAAGAAVVLYLFFRLRSVYVIPVLVGFSRLYLGKHYPLDVLAGWATGVAIALIFVSFYGLLGKRVRSLWMKYRLRI